MENQGRICPRGASYYTWQAGDTLRSVTQQAGTTVQAMQLVNPDVDFSTIPIGTEICLPSQSYTCVSGMAYSVRAGETFTSMAEESGVFAEKRYATLLQPGECYRCGFEVELI